MSTRTEELVAAMLRRGFPDTTQALEWLEERLANCIRIGDERSGEDRDGWAEDAAFFAKTLAIIQALSEGPGGSTKH